MRSIGPNNTVPNTVQVEFGTCYMFRPILSVSLPAKKAK